MTVYIEAAFLENFLLDGVLLFLALTLVHVRVRPLRLVLASAAGAAEAILFPLLALPVWAAYVLKLIGGAILVLLAVKEKGVRPYLFSAGAFFFFTFALGGLLTAAYSFFGVRYEEGNGYLVEQAPVGLIIGGGAAFAIAAFFAARALYRYRKTEKDVLPCKLKAGAHEVVWRGYADSGNNLFFKGSPVCVVSPTAAFALYGRELSEVGRLDVKTVNGSRAAPVFSCDSLQISVGRRTILREHVYLTVGDVGPRVQLILNTALMEA